jgi:hypothetical protein
MEIQVPEPKDSVVVNYGFALMFLGFGSAFLKGKKKGRGIWPWIGNLI